MSIHDWYEDVIGRLSFLEKASADPSKSHEAGKIFQQMKDLFEKTCEWVNPGRLLSSAGLYNSNRYVADRLIKTQQEEIFKKINTVFSNVMKEKSFSLFFGDELRVKFFVGSEEDRLKVIEELSSRGDIDTLFGCLGCCCFQGDEKWVEKILQISINSKPFNFFIS